MPNRVKTEPSVAPTQYLPAAAQSVYQEAFNRAYAAHAGEADRDQRSKTIAWAAVKRLYVMTEEHGWIARAEVPVRQA